MDAVCIFVYEFRISSHSVYTPGLANMHLLAAPLSLSLFLCQGSFSLKVTRLLAATYSNKTLTFFPVDCHSGKESMATMNLKSTTLGQCPSQAGSGVNPCSIESVTFTPRNDHYINIKVVSGELIWKRVVATPIAVVHCQEWLLAAAVAWYICSQDPISAWQLRQSVGRDPKIVPLYQCRTHGYCWIESLKSQIFFHPFLVGQWVQKHAIRPRGLYKDILVRIGRWVKISIILYTIHIYTLNMYYIHVRSYILYTICFNIPSLQSGWDRLCSCSIDHLQKGGQKSLIGRAP